MGISGLLCAIRDVAEAKHISAYRGKRAGVDAHGWLHRGCTSCAEEIATGEPTRRFVQFCLAKVLAMEAAGVTPVLVFDGGYIGAKRGTGEDRSARRAEQRKQGIALREAGDSAAAHKCFQKAVSVTPAMALQLQTALARRTPPVEFVVAPYEADAQLAYMAMHGLVDVVVSEDSDMLVFGCPVVFTKFECSGNGLELAHANLGACEKLDLLNWSHGMFLTMCVLAGCDFLPSPKGIGIHYAHGLVALHRRPEKVLKMLRFEKKRGFDVPEGYERRFWAALATFQVRSLCARRVAARRVGAARRALGVACLLPRARALSLPPLTHTRPARASSRTRGPHSTPRCTTRAPGRSFRCARGGATTTAIRCAAPQWGPFFISCVARS
jgi:exonuclease-1